MRNTPRDGRAPSAGHPPARSFKDPLLAVAVNLLAIGALLGLAWAFNGESPGRDGQAAARRAVRIEWTPVATGRQAPPGQTHLVQPTPGQASPLVQPADWPAWLRAPDAIAAPWTIEPDSSVRWQR